MEKYKFAILFIVWDTILHQLNTTSKTLQKETAELSTIVQRHEGVVTFMESLWIEYEVFEGEVKKWVDNRTYEERRTVKQKCFIDEKKDTEGDRADPLQKTFTSWPL